MPKEAKSKVVPDIARKGAVVRLEQLLHGATRKAKKGEARLRTPARRKKS